MRPKDEEVFERDGFCCVYCGFDGRDFKNWAFLQVDHFKPRSLGGTDELENLVTSCIVCNHMKGAKSWPDRSQARAEIKKYWDQMEEYWKVNVRHLVKPKEKINALTNA